MAEIRLQCLKNQPHLSEILLLVFNGETTNVVPFFDLLNGL